MRPCIGCGGHYVLVDEGLCGACFLVANPPKPTVTPWNVLDPTWPPPRDPVIHEFVERTIALMDAAEARRGLR